MKFENRHVPNRRRSSVALAVILGALLAVVLLVAPATWAAPAGAQRALPLRASSVDAAATTQRPLLTSSAPVTVYLPLVYRRYPPVYYDDFSDPASGWPVGASSICNSNTNEPITYAERDYVTYWTRGYTNGEYQFFIPPANATAVWFCQPDALAPWIIDTDVYTVETLVRYVDGKFTKWNLNPWWDNAGLVFGANEANTQLFMICLGTETYTDAPRSIRWSIHANTPYPYKIFDVEDKPYKFPYRGCSEDSIRVARWFLVGINGSGYNHLMAAVNGDTVRIYINGVFGGQWTLPGLAATTRVGVIGGPYEFTPSDIRFDWFKVTLQ